MNVYTRLAISTLPGDIKVVSILLFIIKSRIGLHKVLQKRTRKYRACSAHKQQTHNNEHAESAESACIPRYPN